MVMSWAITLIFDFVRIIFLNILQLAISSLRHLLLCVQPRRGPYPRYQRNRLSVVRAFHGRDCRHGSLPHHGRARQHILDTGCVRCMRSGHCNASRVGVQSCNMGAQVSPPSPHTETRPPSYGAATTRQRRSTSPPLRQPSVPNSPLGNAGGLDTSPFEEFFYSD